ncbi:outer membrane beta-barrel family protein [Pedobacter lusitanus]|uniref:outer membrane beta-barrel family protein n=1 Tax=Pedobacter lusitanus TaxID=1503925 RepID=UPI00069704D5|nr:outer membrane beta-barrel family protein [Pedobacter lusitanus]
MSRIFITLFSFILLAGINVCAQSVNIKGIVIDTNTRKGIEFATVTLLSVKDSLPVKSVFTDASGRFQLTSVQNGTYLLLTSSLEYHWKYHGPLQISSARQELDLGLILMQVNQRTLKGVEVVAQVPLFRNRANGTVEVNVANTILATNTTAIEILSKSPNINVTETGVFVLGKGEAIIYLNGRRITTEQLSSISASQIRKIEIITNPSSKYDAEGKSVINVITTTNAEEGYKGSFRQAYTRSDFSPPGANTNLDANFRRGKLSLTGNYGLLLGNTREILNTTRSRLKSTDQFRSVLMTDWNRKYTNFSNYNFGGQYDLNEKSYFSAEYSGSYNHLGGSTQSENAITSTVMSGLFKSNTANDNVTRNNSVTLNYNRNPDSLGSAFFIGAQYAGYVSDTDDHISEDNLVDEQVAFRILNNKAGYKIRLANAQLDYTKAFDLNHKLDFGMKYSYAANKSYSDFFITKNDNVFFPDGTQSADFKYQENIPAVYLNFNGQMNEKINYGLGIRNEWTSYKLETNVQGLENIKDSYFNLFPNAFISIKPADQTLFRFSYTSRITRPRYQSLNPSGIYQDAYTSIEGNPYLKPEKTHAFEAGLSYKVYSFKVGYNHTTDAISGAAIQGKAENTYVLKPLNFDRLDSWFISLSVPFNRDWWTSMNTVDMTYNKYMTSEFLYGLKRSRPQLHLYSVNSFKIGNLFRIQALGRYTGDLYDGIFYRKNQILVALGLEKDFLNKALRLNFTANDIFRRDRPSGSYEIGETYIEFARMNNNKYYRMTLSYNFGRLKKVTYSNKSTGQDENSRVR